MTNEEVEKVIEDVCEICKYPNLFLATYIDAEDAHEQMLEQVCSKCTIAERIRNDISGVFGNKGITDDTSRI